MRIRLAATLACAMSVCVTAAHPSQAQYAAQLYPYCSLSSASGATTCYFRAREECGDSCISNPWYIGAERASHAVPHGRYLDPASLAPTPRFASVRKIRRHHSRHRAS